MSKRSREYGSEPPFAGITQEQLYLVKAATGEQPIVEECWLRWREVVRFDEIDIATYRLLPVVYQNLLRVGIEDELLSRLKGIYRRSFYQDSLLFVRVKTAIAKLQNSGIEGLFLKGAPLCLLFYGGPGMRPMSDVDFLIKKEKVLKATQILEEDGWNPIFHSMKNVLNLVHAASFVDSQSNSIDLHWNAIEATCIKETDHTFWKDAVSFNFQGLESKTLNPTDHLLHVLCHGAKWSAVTPVRWMIDAVLILRSSEINWSRFGDEAEKRFLSKPSIQGLRFLSKHLDIPIPQNLATRLDQNPTTWFDRRFISISQSDQSKIGPFGVGERIFIQNLRKNRGGIWRSFLDSCRMIRAFPFAENSYWKGFTGSVRRFFRRTRLVLSR